VSATSGSALLTSKGISKGEEGSIVFSYVRDSNAEYPACKSMAVPVVPSTPRRMGFIVMILVKCVTLFSFEEVASGQGKVSKLGI
jgi:hypothetical protein